MEKDEKIISIYDYLSISKKNNVEHISDYRIDYNAKQEFFELEVVLAFTALKHNDLIKFVNDSQNDYYVQKMYHFLWFVFDNYGIDSEIFAISSQSARKHLLKLYPGLEDITYDPENGISWKHFVAEVNLNYLGVDKLLVSKINETIIPPDNTLHI